MERAARKQFGLHLGDEAVGGGAAAPGFLRQFAIRDLVGDKHNPASNIRARRLRDHGGVEPVDIAVTIAIADFAAPTLTGAHAALDLVVVFGGVVVEPQHVLRQADQLFAPHASQREIAIIDEGDEAVAIDHHDNGMLVERDLIGAQVL
jgi:hypothetical protein